MPTQRVLKVAVSCTSANNFAVCSFFNYHLIAFFSLVSFWFRCEQGVWIHSSNGPRGTPNSSKYRCYAAWKCIFYFSSQHQNRNLYDQLNEYRFESKFSFSFPFLLWINRSRWAGFGFCLGFFFLSSFFYVLGMGGAAVMNVDLLSDFKIRKNSIFSCWTTPTPLI